MDFFWQLVSRTKNCPMAVATQCSLCGNGMCWCIHRKTSWKFMPAKSGARQPPQLPTNTKLLPTTQPIFTLILFFRKSHFVLLQSEHRKEPKHRALHWIVSASLLIINFPNHGVLSAENERLQVPIRNLSRMHALLPQTVTRMSCQVSRVQARHFFNPLQHKKTDKQASKND